MPRAGNGTASTESSERATALMLAAIFFMSATGYAAGQSAGYALFVEAYGARALPVALLAMPIVGGLVTAANLAVARRRPLAGVVVANVIAMTVISVVLWLAVSTSDARPLRFVLPMWDAAVNNVNNLVVWSLAGRLFDVRAAKRWGSMVSSGRSLALVLGGVIVPPAVAMVGTTGLYSVQAVCFLGALALVGRLARRRRPALRATGSPTAVAPRGKRSTGYVRVIFTVVLCSMTSYVLVRNLFLDRAAAVHPDAAEYAGVIAVVGAAQGAVTFLSAVFFGRPFLRRFGLRGGLLLLPVVLVSVYLPMSALGLEPTSQFVLASAGYVVAGAVMQSVRTPSIQVLYQPLPAVDRARAVSIAEGIVEPVAVGLAALTLLAVTRALGWGAAGMAAAIALGGGLLGLAGVRAFRRYRSALEQAVSRRWLRSDGATIDDVTTREILCTGLERRGYDDVVAIIGLLDSTPEGAEDILVSLLGHPDPMVVRYALTRLRNSRRQEAIGAARGLTSSTSEELRARARQIVAGSDPQAAIEEWLDDPSERVATLTMAGALGSDSPAIRRRGLDRATAWSVSPDARTRLRFATAVSEAGRPLTVPGLDGLLADPVPEVRRAAIVAAGHCLDPTHAERLVAELGGAERAVVAEALVRLGRSAFPALDTAWQDADAPTRRRIVRVAGRIADGPATDLLVRAGHDADAAVRLTAARALAERGHRLDRDDVSHRVNAEMSSLAEWLRPAAGPSTAPSDRAAALAAMRAHDAVVASRQVVAWTLAGGEDAAFTPAIAVGLVHDDPRQRAYAVEAAELALPPEHRSLVVTLLTDDDPARLLAAIDGRSAGRGHSSGSSGAPAWSNELMDDTVERIITLRQVELFAGLPVDTLIGIAELLEELVLEEGETLFAAGDPGTSMFVVASGAVRVHRNGRELEVRGAHRVFGELSLLDSAPRSASVTAIAPTRLYRVEQGPFYELMTDRPDVVRRMIHEVVTMLRDRLDDQERSGA